MTPWILPALVILAVVIFTTWMGGRIARSSYERGWRERGEITACDGCLKALRTQLKHNPHIKPFVERKYFRAGFYGEGDPLGTIESAQHEIRRLTSIPY